MSEIVTVDTRGLSCPEPVLLARRAIQKLGKGAIEVLADSGTARDNISRLAAHAGWQLTIEEQPEGVYRIVLKK